jgi:post-segregation antitoxin (ccd killing protein)
MGFYTEVVTIKISKTQKETLGKLKIRNIRVSDFIRKAIAEKIKRDASELTDKTNIEYCPFSSGTIVLNNNL